MTHGSREKLQNIWTFTGALWGYGPTAVVVGVAGMRCPRRGLHPFSRNLSNVIETWNPLTQNGQGPCNSKC